MKKASKGKKLAGLYLRGDVWWFTYRLAGKKRFHSLATGDYGEAVKKALEIRANPTLEPAAVFEQEIVAFMAHKLARKEYTQFSAETKIYTLRRFVRMTGRANPAQVTPEDALAFYRGLQQEVAETTVQTYLGVIKAFYNWLVSVKKVRVSPLAGMKLDRLDSKGREKFCSPALRDKLIAECSNPDLKMILFMGFHAGMRKNEIIQARPEWFDLERGLLTIRATPTFRPKDRQERTLPLTTAFRAFLVSHGLPGPFVLHPEIKASTKLYRFSFRRVFESYMKVQGCEWVTPHVMRHTMASLLASAGVSIYKIAVWMGDDVNVVQKHYAKLSPDDGDIEKAFA